MAVPSNSLGVGGTHVTQLHVLQLQYERDSGIDAEWVKIHR